MKVCSKNKTSNAEEEKRIFPIGENQRNNALENIPEVNIHTGAAVYRREVLSVGAGKYAVRVFRCYNTDFLRLNRTGNVGLGIGWRLNVQQCLIRKESAIFYVDGYGKIHRFKRCREVGEARGKSAEKPEIFKDTGGAGLTLYTHKTFEKLADCSVVRDREDNYFIFDAEGKTVRMIFAPCDIEKLHEARAIAVEYNGEKLAAVYDNRAGSVKIVFEYTAENITRISVQNGAEILKSVEFSYESGLLTSCQNGSIGEEYSYDRDDFTSEKPIAETSENKPPLTGIFCAETNFAAKISYENGSPRASKISVGSINDIGDFIEKSHSRFAYFLAADAPDGSGYVVKTEVTDEKGTCMRYMFNEDGETVSAFEKGCGLYVNYSTQQKEIGESVAVDNKTDGIELINNRWTFRTENSVCRAQKIVFRKSGDSGAENYVASGYIKLENRAAAPLYVVMRYTSGETRCAQYAKIDEKAVKVWQKASVYFSVPKENGGATVFTDVSFAVYGDSAPVAAEFGEIFIAPSGVETTIFSAPSIAPVDIREARVLKLTGINGAETRLNLRKRIAAGENEVEINGLALTYGDLLNTAVSAYRNRGGKSGFGVFYNGGKDCFIGVKDVKILFAHGEAELFDPSTGQCNFTLRHTSADNKTVTETRRRLKEEGVLCTVTVTAKSKASNGAGISSSTSEFSAYDGRKLSETDAYGITTSYGYDSLNRLTHIKKSKNGKETLLSAVVYDGQGSFVESVSSGFSSESFVYEKPFETLLEINERAYNFSQKNYADTGLKKQYSYDENGLVNRILLRNGENVFFRTDISYQNGQIRTISDGNSKFGIKRDAAHHKITYSAFDGETETDIQERSEISDQNGEISVAIDRYFKGAGNDDVITTVTDNYGRVKTVNDGLKTTQYLYAADVSANGANVSLGSESAGMLHQVNDPYENRAYRLHYDGDERICGREVEGKLSVRTAANGKTGYAFKRLDGTNEAYLTADSYDKNVVIRPRLTGVKTYETVCAGAAEPSKEKQKVKPKEKRAEIKLYTTSYEYDEFGRTACKAQNKGKYAYSYFTGENNTLLPNLQSAEFSFGGTGKEKWSFSFSYDSKGNLIKKETVKSDGRSVAATYAYDEANRLSAEKIEGGYYNGLERRYTYQSNGKGKLLSVSNTVSIEKLYSYDRRGRLERYNYDGKDHVYAYDNYGNVTEKKEAGKPTAEYACEWERGNLLKTVDKGETRVAYEYNHLRVRFRKNVNGEITEYYVDGSKILGENRADGTEIRYFYDREGLLGFRYNKTYFGYVKDGQNNVAGIVDSNGQLCAQYEYDSFGNTLVLDSAGQLNGNADFIGNVNPFRWKSYYFDVETGFYYANGRYYEASRGGYINAYGAELLEKNAYNLAGLDRNGILR